MRGGALPPALLAAALAAALAFAPRRAMWAGAALFALTTIAAGLLRPPSAWTDGLFLWAWASVAVTAATVHWPGGVRGNLAVALAGDAGLCGGLLIAAAGKPIDLAVVLIPILALPAAWIVSRGWGIGIKVAASWLIAIALLAAFLPLTTKTPGYAPDHMD